MSTHTQISSYLAISVDESDICNKQVYQSAFHSLLHLSTYKLLDISYVVSSVPHHALAMVGKISAPVLYYKSCALCILLHYLAQHMQLSEHQGE